MFYRYFRDGGRTSDHAPIALKSARCPAEAFDIAWLRVRVAQLCIIGDEVTAQRSQVTQPFPVHSS